MKVISVAGGIKTENYGKNYAWTILFPRVPMNDNNTVAGQVNSLAIANAATLTSGLLYAIPFIAPSRKVSVSQITTSIAVVGTGNIRIGIYGNTSNQVLYPSGLLYDSGPLRDTLLAPAAKGVNHNELRLTPGQLYWAAAVRDTTQTNGTRSLAAGGFFPQMGLAVITDASPQIGWVSAAALVAVALPDPYPAGATASSVTMPAIGLKYLG